jgi:hypothetical protein
VIADVLAYASREATMERRRSFAALIRATLLQPGCAPVGRVAADLESLALELEDEELVLEPACAVACSRQLSDPVGSPLLDPARPSDELRSRVFQIRSGFAPRRLVA